VILPLVFVLAAAAPAREVRVVMGTTAEVFATGLAEPAPALEAAFAALASVDDQMSLWKQSELTRLNAAGEAVVSEELLVVIAASLEMAAASGGAFDPTVEPLVRASGGLGGSQRHLSAAERARLLPRVGAARVHVDAATRHVRMQPGTAIDLGGIAKGFAADRALDALRRAGATSGFVDLGGSSLGVFGQPLTVDVRNPIKAGGLPWASFTVADRAVASSGSDQKPDHILDPRTGAPAHRVLATTVVAKTGIEADALSTAVYVLGPTDGIALLERRGAAGLVLLRERGRNVIVTTRGFREAFDLEPAAGVRVRE
jgi:thiamine biosynthesis lipoprotein